MNQYLILTLCALTAFLFTLAVHVLVFNLWPSSRLGFAVLISVVPALLVLLAIRLFKLSTAKGGVVAIYILMFLMVVILQGVLRMI